MLREFKEFATIFDFVIVAFVIFVQKIV